MNIAFYIDSTNSTPRNMEIYNGLNKLVDENKVVDANLFYNNIDYVPIQPKFGMFNSHNIWNFTGTLVCTSLDNLFRAVSSVNKFKTIYMYDKSQKNLIALLQTVGTKVVTTNQADYQEYYRLTGEKPNLLEKIEDIVDLGSF